MGKRKSIGLPGGPNEFLIDITQYISVDGYRNDSPDKTNPVNFIPSGNISMKDVDFPIMGVDNLGNSQMMMPENEYQFPGDMVMETPMAQNGIEVPKRQGARKNPDGSESTHLMATETLDGKNWFSFPTLFQDPDGTWVDMSNKPWKEAYEEAKRRGELIDFGEDKEAAIKFGEGSWKPKFQLRGEVNDIKGVVPNQESVDNSFQRQWLDSPMYKKILANEVGPNDDAEFITNSRIGNLQNVPIIVNPNTHEDEGVGATSWSKNGELEFFKPSHTNHEGHVYENTFEHEVGHSGDRVGKDTLKRYKDNLSIGDKIALANASLSTRPSSVVLPNYVALANQAYNYITGQETNDLEDRAIQIYKNLNSDRLIPQKTIKRFEDERVNIEGYDDDGNPIINNIDIASYGTYDADGNPIVAFNRDGSVKEGQIEIQRSPWGDYVSDPTEARTRLNTIRSAAKDLGIYDPMTEPLTREKFQEIIDRTSELNRGESDGYNPLMQLQDVYSNDEIFNQLNEISSVDDSKDKSRYAQSGLEVLNRFYTPDENVNIRYNEGDVYESIFDPRVREKQLENDAAREAYQIELNKRNQSIADIERAKELYKDVWYNQYKDTTFNTVKERENWQENNPDWQNAIQTLGKYGKAKVGANPGVSNKSNLKHIPYFDPAADLSDQYPEMPVLKLPHDIKYNLSDLPSDVDESVFRQWINKYYPDYAENNKIDSFTSIKNNDTIKSAWYELGHQFVEKPELKPLQKLMSDFDMNDKPSLSEPVKNSKSKLVSIKAGDGRFIVRDTSTGGTIGIYDSEEKAKLAMSGVDNEDIIDYYGPSKWNPNSKQIDTQQRINKLYQRGGNTLDDAVIPVLKGAAEKADSFNDWLGKKTKDILNPELDLETRFKIFQEVRPESYPGFGSITKEAFGAIGNALGITEPTKPLFDSDGDYDFSEEAWARALGLNPKEKYIQKQTEYSPTNSKEEGVQYYKISDDILDRESMISDFKDLPIGYKETVDGLAGYMKEDYWSKTEDGSDGKVTPEQFMNIDPLQNFQVEVGYDKAKDQKYLSIYDKYDFNSIANAAIKPYEFYDRIYIPKDSDKKVENKNSIDPNLLYKQAYVESNLNPKAKSSAGYMGLGQIGDSLIADYKKAKNVKEIDPYDPEQNHDVQEWSMNELYNSSFINKENQDQDVRLIKTLAAYNWGRGNTRDLLNELKEEGLDIYNDIQWVSRLPKETQDYIDMILFDKNTEGRPNVQENFLKTTTDEAYDYYKQLYKYQDDLPEKQFAGPVRENEQEGYDYSQLWMPSNYVEELPELNSSFVGPLREPEKQNEKPKEELNIYTVKSGDNLTRIADKYGTTVDEIAELNDIANPSKISINQEIKLPKSKTKYAFYDVKSGDTLGRIATKYGTTVRKLAQENDISNINEIFVNQELRIPQDSYEPVDEIEETWQDVELLDQDRRNINDSSDEDIIKKSQMVNDPNGHYVIVNKKTKRLEVWRGGKSVLDFEVLTGANEGDALTVTKMWDLNNDGQITDEDKRNGKWIPNWSAGNKNTGAGKYYIKESYADSPDKYGGKGVPSFNLYTDGTDIDVATAIHGPTKGRKGLFDDGNIDNNRASNGCVNGQCSDLQALYDLGMPAGTAVYILPEDEGNNFQWVDGQAVLKMSKDNREKYTSNYIDSKGREQTQQGSNYTVNTLNYQPIRPVFDQQAFEEDVYNETGGLKSVGNFFTSDTSDKEEQENSTKPFINALVNNKKQIMQEAGIPSDVYNDIARIAFGIYGNESNFGDTHSKSGNLLRGANKYVADLNKKGQLPVVGSTNLLPTVTSSPDVFKKYEGFTLDTTNQLSNVSPLLAIAAQSSNINLPTYSKSAQEDYNSVGLTQLRWENIAKEDKNLPENKKQINILKKFGITSNKDLLDPEKAAIATVLRLAFLANNREGVDRNDLFNTLPKHWGGSSKDDGKTYTEGVKKNAKYLKFQQLGKYMPDYKIGGEKKKLQMYKDYMDGIYDGTNEEAKAKSIYDKLNRKHYKDAKELGNMSPPNYILTHLYKA